MRRPAALDVVDLWLPLGAICGVAVHGAGPWLLSGVTFAVWPGEVVLLAGRAGIRRAVLLAVLEGRLTTPHGCVMRDPTSQLCLVDASPERAGGVDALIESARRGAAVLAHLEAPPTRAGTRRVQALRRRAARAVPTRIVWLVRGRSYVE